jgi:hypothetical protein
MNRIVCRLLAGGLMIGTADRAVALGAGCGAPLPGHIRVIDARLAVDIACGIERSPALRAAVDRIGQLNGVVYVTTAVRVRTASHHALLAGLAHEVTVAGSTRILRITAEHNYGDSAVATIAHEFRHAIEVLDDPSVRTGGDVTALFERIGRSVSAGVVETTAAGDFERVVLLELHASRSRR